MRFTDIPAKIETYRIKRTDRSTAPLAIGPVLSVAPCRTRPGEIELRVKEALIFVKPTTDVDTRRLMTDLASGSAILARLANPAADGSVELQIAFFAGECLDMGAVEIGADEYVERKYAAIARQDLSGKKLYEALGKRCCYDHDDQPYFFFFAGPAIDRALSPEEEEGNADGQEETEEGSDIDDEPSGDQSDSVQDASASHPEPTRKNSLCVVGDGIRFIATETVRPDGKAIYIATGLTKVRAEPDRALRLAKGKLTFSDWTQAGRIQMLTKAQMLALTQDDGSYLKRWDEFVAIEGEMVLDQARKIGALQYSEMVPNRDGTVTVLVTQASDSALQALSDRNVESVEIADDLPEYLDDQGMTFAQFTGVIEREAENEAFFGKRGNQRRDAVPHYDVVDYDAVARKLTLKTENLPASGTLVLSLAGQIAQIKRPARRFWRGGPPIHSSDS